MPPGLPGRQHGCRLGEIEQLRQLSIASEYPSCNSRRQGAPCPCPRERTTVLGGAWVIAEGLSRWLSALVITEHRRVRGGGLWRIGGRASDYGTLSCPGRRISVARSLTQVISETCGGQRGSLPGAGDLSCWRRRVVGWGTESFLVSEACTGDHADNFPWVEDSPPGGRKLSAIMNQTSEHAHPGVGVAPARPGWCCVRPGWCASGRSARKPRGASGRSWPRSPSQTRAGRIGGWQRCGSGADPERDCLAVAASLRCIERRLVGYGSATMGCCSCEPVGRSESCRSKF